MQMNHMMKPLLTVTFLGALATAASANIISLNISTAGGANTQIDGGETFGVPAEDSVSGNWNNMSGMGSGNPLPNLIDNNGVATAVTATAFNAGGNQFWGADYINTPWNYGIAHFTGTTNPVSIAFSGLGAEFTAGYFAIVYVNGAAANSGAAVTDGSTTFYFQTSNPANTSPLRITDLDPGDGYDVGNYAIFGSADTPLTGDSITFSIPTGSVLSSNVGIGGVQLVAVPEPGMFGMVTGLVALGLLIAHRRCTRSTNHSRSALSS